MNASDWWDAGGAAASKKYLTLVCLANIGLEAVSILQQM